MFRRLSPSLLLAAAVSLATATPVAARTASPPPDVVYEPPVESPVVDPFRPPATRYGPGNRGLTYGTKPGTVVRASADGRVVFAGRVGTSLHVTVLHADGVRTSYSFLRRIDVRLGQNVTRGDRLGIAGPRFHLGARRGAAYFDPASLFGSGDDVEVELLPLEIPPGASPAQERAAIVELVWGTQGGGLDLSLPSPGDVLAWTAERTEVAQQYLRTVNPVVRSISAAQALADRLQSQDGCSDEPAPRRPIAGRNRRAILVGGLGSSSASASVDDLRASDLGYSRNAVHRFSYRGDGRPYTSSDTQEDLHASARRLADSVQQELHRHPSTTLDLYGHSMGGVVVRLALGELKKRGVDLRRLGLVVTLGSPNRGADLATAISATDLFATGSLGLHAGEQLVGTGLDPDGQAVTELSETSDVVEELKKAGVPEGVDLLSIGAAGDMIVAAPNTRVDGARNVTVGLTGMSAHSDLVGDPETTDEIARALAGGPPGCEDVGEVVREEALGQGISYAEDVVGFSAVNGVR